MRYISLFFTTIILLSCGGGGGGGSAPLPTVFLSASTNSVPVNSPVTITWTSSNASSCQASGAWSGTKGTSGSESVFINLVGANNFNLSCSGSGGSGQASTSVEGYRQVFGVTADGYVRGAEIFIDENEDFIFNIGENFEESTNGGSFAIRFENGTLISLGGTDLDTGILLDNLLMLHRMDGHSDFKVITPVTTIASFFTDKLIINNALGIDSSIDIFSTDPVFYKDDNGIYEYLYEKGNQLTVIAFALTNFINYFSETASEFDPLRETTKNAFELIANEVESTFSETTLKIDIESKIFIDALLARAEIFTASNAIDESILQNASILLSGLLPVVELKEFSFLTDATLTFALETFQTDFLNVLDNSISDDVVNSYETDILNYIAEDQGVDPDLLAPEITAINNSIVVDEDNAIQVDVLNNDSYLSSAPITITVGAPGNGSAVVLESQPPTISYLPNADYNGSDVFDYTIFQGDKVSTAQVLVSINPINDPPVINVASTLQAPENQTYVDNISVSDVDGDTLTISLEGADKDVFSLDSANDLYFNSPPDYEGTNSFNISFSVSDGELTTTKDISVLVTNVNDVPPEITTADAVLSKEMCTLVTTLAATDIEGDDLTWAMSGDENNQFNLNSITGDLSYNEYPTNNLEGNQIEELDISVFDGVHTVSKTISITLQIDPLYPYQWVLENTGQKNFADLAGTPGADANVKAADCRYTGKGVIVSIIDEGLELAHEDLVDNIVPGSFDWVEQDEDPTNTSLTGDHGTAVSGIIAMKGHNNLGGRGIAPDAHLVGYNWLLSQSDANLFSSFNGLDYTVEVGVANNSWGRGSSQWYMPPVFDSDTWDAIATITENSRAGKGTVFVKSNGNSWAIGGYCGPNQALSDEMPCTTTSTNDPISVVPYFVGVPALNADDQRSSYSTPGSASWISGYGGEFGYGPPNYLAENYSEEQQRYFKAAVMSTDQSTCDIGYIRTENDAGTPRNAFSTGDHPLNLNCDYMPHMNGTSSAGPTVAALVAILLEVNSDFTWRDIKHIMASTATKIDEDRSKNLTFNNEEISIYSWKTNAAGFNFHNWFGFGKLNVADAITFAEDMVPNSLGDFITYGLVTAEDNDPEWDLNIADQKLSHSISLSANEGTQGKVEWIRLRFWFDYPDMSDIGLRLTSPDGTTLNVLYPFAYKVNNPKNLTVDYDFEEYYFDVGVAGFYGENLAGEWTLEVINWESGGCPEVTDDDGNTTVQCTTGILENWGIIAYGN